MKKLTFRFNKIKWDKVLSAALVIVLLVGCTAGLATIFNTKTTDVSDFNFKKGALDSSGFYIESDTSIYTKDLIACQGLVIEPDFEATGNYQVFYYGSNKNFIGSSDLLDAHLDGVYEKGTDFPTAKYCRIVISPSTPTDEDGFVEQDWKIRFWQVADYASDYKITVNKKQNNVIVSHEGDNKLVIRYDSSCNLGDGANNFMITDYGDGEGFNLSELVTTTGFNNICIVAEQDKLDDVTIHYLAPTSYLGENTLNELDGDVVKKDGMIYITMDVPSSCAGIVLQSEPDVDFANFEIYVW